MSSLLQPSRSHAPVEAGLPEGANEGSGRGLGRQPWHKDGARAGKRSPMSPVDSGGHGHNYTAMPTLFSATWNQGQSWPLCGCLWVQAPTPLESPPCRQVLQRRGGGPGSRGLRTPSPQSQSPILAYHCRWELRAKATFPGLTLGLWRGRQRPGHLVASCPGSDQNIMSLFLLI